jgi:uncharacterized protein (DUF779 family)
MDVADDTGRHREEPSLDGTTFVLTDAAERLIDQVREERGEVLSLVIGNGCCDSTAPFLFSGYMAGPNERMVCELNGVAVFIDRSVAGGFAGREIVIDASPDPQPDSFSCEAELGWRFRLDRLPLP